MKFILSKDKFEISEKEDLTSGSISYYEIPVETDEEWEGLDIEAVIIEANAEKGVGKAVINNKVFIDRTISGSYLIGFRGYKIKNNEKTYQISTKLKQIKFKKGAGEVELQNDEDLPSLSEWEIYISEIQDMITQVQTSTTIATTQAGIATTKANEASTSAANAQTSAEKAEESAASVEQIVSDFEDNAENKTTAFNTNATNKTTSYNNNATQKTDIFNSNATTKTNEFNEIVVNAEQDISDTLEEIDAKINSFNNNATQKTTEYNNNAEGKLNTYNENATTKISNYNNNAVEKLQDYNNNAEEKITEFNNQLKQQYYTKEEIEKVLDTNEVEGTEIHIEDAKEFNILDFIVDGKSEQAGEPTPDNPSPIENVEGDIVINDVGKNIIPFPYYDKRTAINGVEIEVKDDGSIILNGTATATGYFQLIYNDNIKLKQGEYYLSGLTTGSERTYYLQPFINDKSRLAQTTTPQKYEILEGDILNRISLFFLKDTVFNNLIVKPQFEYSKLTDYEPYKSQTAYFPLGEEKLMEGSYLADDGIHHSRKQVVLDGSDDENWTKNGTNQGYAIAIDNVGGNAVGNVTSSVLCNKLTAVPQNTIYNGSAINGVASYGGTVSKLYVRFDSSITTSELLREKLAESPILIEYELAEPETVPFTAEQQEAWNKIKALKTFKGVNNIRVDTNLGLTNAKVTYAQDLKKRLEKIEEAIVAMGGVE